MFNWIRKIIQRIKKAIPKKGFPKLRNRKQVNDFFIKQELMELGQQKKLVFEPQSEEIKEKEKKLFGVKTFSQRQKEKEKLLDEAIKKASESKEDSHILKNMNTDQIEKAIAEGIRTLSDPKILEYFSVLNKEEADLISLGISVGTAIQFDEYTELFYRIAKWRVSSKEGLGRKQLVEISKALGEREKESGLMDRLLNWRNKNQ